MIHGDKTGAVCQRICQGIAEAKISYAAFERQLCVPPKTVSNWRRGVSHSYLSMLPQIAELLSTTPDVLLGGKEKAEEEWQKEAAQLSTLYAKAKGLSRHRRKALYQTLEQVIQLYLEE